MRYILLIAVGLLAASAAFAWLAPGIVRPYLPDAVARHLPGDDGDDKVAGADGASRPAAVYVAKPTTAAARDTFTTTGEITAKDAVTVASEVSGRIEVVHVTDGQRVEKGEPLVRFDSAEQEAQLAAAQARLTEASENLSRQRKLSEKDFAAEATVEQAVSAKDTAEAEVARARERLEDRTLEAPFSGEISFVDVSVGAFVEPGQPITRMATTDALRATFQLPLAVVDKVRIGSRVTVKPIGSQEQIEAKIDVIAPLASSARRSVQAEARLPETATLRPGAFVEVAVVTQTREDALFVPETAVVRQGQRAVVYIVSREGTAQEVEVQLGARREPGLIEVTGERVNASTSIVSGGVQKVSDGQKVEVVEPPRNDGSDGAGGGTEAPRTQPQLRPRPERTENGNGLAAEDAPRGTRG